MPKTKLAPYWSPWHTSAADEQLFAKWKPRIIKIMVNSSVDVGQLPVALRCAEQVVIRSYPISEDRRLMASNPAALGAKHAREIVGFARALADKYKLTPAEKKQLLFEGLNEPKLWTTDEAPQRIAQYYTTLVNDAGEQGVRIVAGNFGIGWPGNNGVDNAPPDWTPFAAMVEAINAHDGMLGVHEYWGLNSPTENWGWWAGRYKTIPWDVSIIITECGIDTGVLGEKNLGWHKLIGVDGRNETQAAETYIYRDLSTYDRQLQLDPRVVAASIFTYDYQNKEWESFDINNADIRTPLLKHVNWMLNQDPATFTPLPMPHYDIGVDWYLPPWEPGFPKPPPPIPPKPQPHPDLTAPRWNAEEAVREIERTIADLQATRARLLGQVIEPLYKL